jgi:hypothetical protein
MSRFFSFLRKKNERELSDLSAKEKKGFLSNDFIERMIRVEQRVSVSLGQPVPYHKTMYYRGLSDQEKKSFDLYLKQKGMKKVFILLPMFFLLVVVGLVNFEFTGNVVKENAESGGWGLLLFPLFVFLIWAYLISVIFRRLRASRFEAHFKVIDDIGLNRYKA